MENKDMLTPLQNNILEMFKWFDSVCRKHSLRYYMVGGTMLGAARHQGFIPWDDDIDVCMPREDYNTLPKFLRQEESERYLLETPSDGDEYFCYPYYKLYDTSTTLIENYHTPLKRGTFIDVFPLDGLGDSEEVAKKTYLKRRRKYTLYIARMAAIRPERSKYKNAFIRIVRVIPQKILDNTKLRMNLDKPKSGCYFDNCKYVALLFGNWGVREVMPKAVFGEPVEYQFEDMKAFGVANYDEYLTRVYGNWMELPPVEKRVTHHDFLDFNLNEPYVK